MSEDLLHPEAPGVTRIDLRWRGWPGRIAAYLVRDGGDLALVDTGPGSTLDTLLAGIRAAGHDPAALTHLVLTHIHLDHAGAAGALARLAPRARVYVHPVGAPHLVDPSRLLASAGTLFGDRMDELWGEMHPVPAERVVAVDDGSELRVGGRVLRAVETPGHAWHHHAWHAPDDALVFTGDVAGIRLGPIRYVRPLLPPPDIDAERWLASLERLRALRPRRLLLAHFGGSDEPGWHLDDLAGRLEAYTTWAAELMAFGTDAERLAGALRRRCEAEVRAAGGTPELARAYEDAVPYDQMAAGLHRYLRTRAARRAAGGR
ncbi:MAG TPA: MBL fold metallo-hydrolase [Longimicrobiaceae bacterium]|nr:MBL fold metallo-hydrolase [Longimicrobiaceae bacterium]